MPINNRVFIMLCDPSLPKSEIHEMNETNGTVNYKAALLGVHPPVKTALEEGRAKRFLILLIYVKKWVFNIIREDGGSKSQKK